MARIEHPPIASELDTSRSFEHLIAEEAYQILETYNYSQIRQLDNRTWVEYAVSERYEVQSAQDTRPMALRLVGIPVMAAGATKENPSRIIAQEEETPAYFVTELQYGYLDNPIDEPEDKDYTWHPYVMIVTNANDTKYNDVLSTVTGTCLMEPDLVQVLMTLTAMRKSLAADSFCVDVSDSALHPQIHKGKGKYVDFDSVDHYIVSACDICGSQNMPCIHNPETLN